LGKLEQIAFSVLTPASQKRLPEKPNDKLRELCHEACKQERSQRDLFADGIELVHAPAHLLEIGFAGH
jgi:hypothetical protein